MQVWRPSGASMAKSRMRVRPIFRVSPSTTCAWPAMVAAFLSAAAGFPRQATSASAASEERTQPVTTL
jgi:hypothetical protein